MGLVAGRRPKHRDLVRWALNVDLFAALPGRCNSPDASQLRGL